MGSCWAALRRYSPPNNAGESGSPPTRDSGSPGAGVPGSGGAGVGRRRHGLGGGGGGGAVAAQGAGPVVLFVLFVVGLGGLPLQLGQPGGVVELGVLVAAAPLGPPAALSPPAHRYAATLPVLVEVKLRSPNTMNRCRAEYRGWQVVMVIVGFG